MTAIDGNDRALRILHLSDTHLVGDGSLHHRVVDTRAALCRILERAAGLARIDLVVAAGDLSDDGSEASYRMLRELLEPWAQERGASVLYAMGNHDSPAGFERVLAEREGVTTLRGFRILRLDSSVPEAGYGALDQKQLDWLRAQLIEPAPNGTIIVVHHPPVPASTALLAALELQNPAELLSVCSGTDVRLILCGHYHHALATSAAGILVIVAPGVANTADVLAPAHTERATTGAGFALIDLPAAGAVRAVFIAAPGADDGTEIFNFDAAEVQCIARAAGPA